MSELVDAIVRLGNAVEKMNGAVSQVAVTLPIEIYMEMQRELLPDLTAKREARPLPRRAMCIVGGLTIIGDKRPLDNDMINMADLIRPGRSF
ncbi:hypothetical protein BA190_26735 [Labrys sp. WJW]|uniref:hypothetical protein n=1 Tax=Labrys sp. WJW TaxID=1737983 RepID=UPI00082ACD74|nr:hypothetical protein [Labrys sp. WJW]OCC01812.1 hypothetical protein BA190_26735 [Labrys sp. WJW]